MDYSLHYLLMASHSALQKNLFKALKDTGLTMGQPKVLDYLKTHDGAGQKEIAAACHIEAPSLTSVLSRMEEKGLIIRKVPEKDRRSYQVFLTAKGQKYVDIVEENFSVIENTAYDGISEREKEVFLRTLLKIYDNLNSSNRGELD